MSACTRAVLTRSWLLAAVLLSGCAAHSAKLAAVRDLSARGEMEAALAAVSEALEPDDLLHQLESGSILHLMGRYAASDSALALAEGTIEDLYTRSLSREGLTYLVNETMAPYDGRPLERLMIPYYRALNHLHMGKRQGALVEARKMNLKRVEMIDAEGAGVAAPLGMTEYLAALLHEAGGDLNAAMVSLRLAREAYGGGPGQQAVPAPLWLEGDLLRVARRGGFQEVSIDSARARRGGAVRPGAGHGELILLFENGWIAARAETRLEVPLLEEETDVRRDGIVDLSLRLEER
ncbi:MAG: hypothetical protein GF355_01045, partial [Candidatus Eisenbacteria bacterium]|nr:hypothetical protein [Candidatus Eisenbacteria bacterium]